MTRIVTSTYRYKRPPRKRKAVALEVPAIMRGKASKSASVADSAAVRHDEASSAPCTETKPANDDRKSSIVTIKRKGRFGDAPDLTSEEYQRRGDAADAMFREMKRRVAEKDQSSPPQRHWRTYGTEPLPSGAEALDEPFSAFPSWFLRITCDRCGKDRMVSETHAPWRERRLRDILTRAHHDGCGGLVGKAELLTGIEGASSRPVRRIVLITDPMLRPAEFRRR